MIFKEDVDGNHHASFYYAPADGQVYQINVTDNRKMYWKLIATRDANNEQEFMIRPKGIYSKPTDVHPVVQLVDTTISFSPTVRMSF